MVSIKSIERVLQLGLNILAIQRQLMQLLATGITVPDDAILLSCHSRTLNDKAECLRGTYGEMRCEGIDNHDFALLHLSNLGLASGIAMLHIDRALELIENFVVRIDMEIIASIRSFDNHENEVGMPKDFFIPY